MCTTMIIEDSLMREAMRATGLSIERRLWKRAFDSLSKSKVKPPFSAYEAKLIGRAISTKFVKAANAAS